MSTVTLEPLIHHSFRRTPKFCLNHRQPSPSSVNYTRRPLSVGAARLSFCNCKHRPRRKALAVRASSTVIETSEVVFEETFDLKRTQRVEGRISIRFDSGRDEENWKLTIGCNLPGKWVLHWGVHYVGDSGSEWDQPPLEMRPQGSITIKDYAIETPLKRLSTALEGESFYEVEIGLNINSQIAAINFVLKDEETGAWYQHRGMDFRVPLMDYAHDDSNMVGGKKGFGIWTGALGQLSDMLLKSEVDHTKGENGSNGSSEPREQTRCLAEFYEEHVIVKETLVDNSVTVSVKEYPETAKNLLQIDTDIPGDVLIHWGVCRDEGKNWELPAKPYPTETTIFKNKALRTLLQQKDDGSGSQRSFTLDEGPVGFVFVLKLDDGTWLNCKGNDFYVPLPRSTKGQLSATESEVETQNKELDSLGASGSTSEAMEASLYTDEIINEIRNLVTDISSEKNRNTKTKEAQEGILQEIEKLAAEAYSIFRSSVPTFSESALLEAEALKPPTKISSGTGSGHEILCQGFNWESHKSGRWYLELQEKAELLSSLGITVVWLPPPTESVSPEGYMPKDLYNLNSRYGTIDELKVIVKRFHEVGIQVLGDVVLNHRCASSRNQNGVWNIFGGRLNWDDRAVVADDPHFQGRGNKSSGDNFHAAPNIDHSQEFVRKDLKEWLCWLREEIGYDGWRLDFVRGFWGGYVKDYLETSEPYFAVGEYWDSLSYTYGEMDHNQDAHRQRIVDWINATNGTAGAFDVTTKGILHSAIERCEYWRLSDTKGKPPGVVGWWPSRAVTFIENHDTGSTQGHWRFPGGKEMQGYAYILTHPGTPSVFYDHVFSGYQSEIGSLLSLRKRNKIHCRSTVKITKAERDVYAAMIDEKLAVKIGPGYYEPPSGPQNWSVALEGSDYKVWESS
ncbi:PREDICTED: alpha-amylase 3, chloroplastic isoform X1 [Ipomoea nil]|uniref:alpha-amylase 3, chloroplastic isoform X1 n=1 Tax=Ipomoea nil TaxID=35883 RepID=UPI0009010788|nr:PREDICTED: alpha-amylase 3, chloroplastic isoform X1 [Ipomoea nil]